jgi:hypothetical protein
MNDDAQAPKVPRTPERAPLARVELTRRVAKRSLAPPVRVVEVHAPRPEGLSRRVAVAGASRWELPRELAVEEIPLLAWEP